MLVAEIGINHDGNIQIAKDLIDIAAVSGCWGVKFQYRDIDFYHSTNEIGDEIISNELSRIELSLTDFSVLTAYARNLGLSVGVSFFRNNDFDRFTKSCGILDFYKVPSAECENLWLIDQLLSTGKRVFVSTGGADLEGLPGKLGDRVSQLDVMHCIANYPVADGMQCLNAIDNLKTQGWRSVGYSSHDESFEMCFLAMGKGIDSLERHITIDKTGVGLDKSSSSDPREFARLGKIFAARDNALRLDSTKRNQGEILNMQNLGTSLIATKPIREGDYVGPHNTLAKGPRVGLSIGDILARDEPVAREVRVNEVISELHFVKRRTRLSDVYIEYCNEHKVGLPVRLHDFYTLQNLFPINCFEFHLSFKEVMRTDFYEFAATLPQGNTYSVHMPDYVNENFLSDIFSDNHSVRKASRELFNNVKTFADQISQLSGREINIVTSFPMRVASSQEFFEQLVEYIQAENRGSSLIIPQWLPTSGWYFGGSVEIHNFNSIEFIELLEEANIKICLDICHLIMSAMARRESWRDWFTRLDSVSNHFHIADASSEVSEGEGIGEGELANWRYVDEMDRMKVIEVWQGHLNEGQGFRAAISELANRKVFG